MDRPQIWAKSALNHGPCNRKMELGADGIEIQLFKSDLKVKEDIGWLKHFPIRAVHVPIINNEAAMIEDIINSDPFVDIFVPTMELANQIGKDSGTMITVVVHSEMSYTEAKGSKWNSICSFVDTLLNTYPYVRIGIENVTPVVVGNNTFKLRNNLFYDNAIMARELRAYTKNDRIGTIIDTCHVYMTRKILSAIQVCLGKDVSIPEFDWDKLFKMHEDVLFHLHLCNAKGNGFGEGHGVGFEDDPEELKAILSAYDECRLGVPLCLELRESDYTVCDNYKKLSNMVKEYYEGSLGNL